MRNRFALFRSASLFVAGMHLTAIVTSPAIVCAQTQPQPVPYNPAPAPVPYSQPSPVRPPAAANAPPPSVGADVIYLKNGGSLRGTIIDAIPNAQARIQLATGEIATVQWTEIARIERAETPRGPPTAAPEPARPLPSLPPAPPSAPLAVPAKPMPPAATVLVHVDGAEDAQLEQDATHEDHWQVVCSAPCDTRLPVGPDYRVSGPGIRTSGIFGLDFQSGKNETITVSAASKPWFVIGIVSTAAGGAAAVVGALVGLGASLASRVDTDSGDTAGAQHEDGVAAAGWTVAGVGALAIVAGIILIVTNAKTRTTQDLARMATPERVASAWQRVPAWKDAGSEPRWMFAPALGMPLFHGSF